MSCSYKAGPVFLCNVQASQRHVLSRCFNLKCSTDKVHRRSASNCSQRTTSPRQTKVKASSRIELCSSCTWSTSRKTGKFGHNMSFLANYFHSGSVLQQWRSMRSTAEKTAMRTCCRCKDRVRQRLRHTDYRLNSAAQTLQSSAGQVSESLIEGVQITCKSEQAVQEKTCEVK